MNQEYETPTPDDNENGARPSFGTELRKAREKLGQSVDEVANALFVRPQLITALEAEDLSVFSAPVYAMGLVRSYARLLEIRPEPLLAALESLESGHEPTLVSVSSTTRSAAVADDRRRSIGMALGALVLLLILGVGLYLNGDEDGGVPPTTTADGGESGAGQTNIAEDMKPPSDGADTPAEDEVANADSDETTDQGLTADKAATEEDAVPEEVAKPEASLLLIFETDSWAEVHDAGGRRLLTRIGRAGQQLSLQGQPPFDVRLGYAPGVRIEYNGQPYVWKQRKGARVAHLRVGVESKP